MVFNLVNPGALPEVEEEETPAAKLGPNLSRLWSYECSATKGMAVNCLVWNKTNHVSMMTIFVRFCLDDWGLEPSPLSCHIYIR